MNTTDPADIHMLPYGCGLAIGLLLILGLPAEAKPANPAIPDPAVNRLRFPPRHADAAVTTTSTRIAASV